MIKEITRKALIVLGRNALLALVFQKWRQRHVPIFMLHRIEDTENGVSGHDPELIRECLCFLKDRRYTFLSLSQLVEFINAGELPPKNSVVFTIDDGFYEQASIAVPIFEEFNCPVSIFIISEFSSNNKLPWDYQLEYIFNQVDSQYLAINSDDICFSETINNTNRAEVIQYFRDALKTRDSQYANKITKSIAIDLGVKLTAGAPAGYRPIDWGFIRKCESNFVDFGPHTANHSILSREEHCIMEREMIESWNTLKEQVKKPLDIFCYPTGRKGLDFASREMRAARSIGFRGAVSTNPGYVDVIQDKEHLYSLKRFALPDNLGDFIQLCSWVELLKHKIRTLVVSYTVKIKR